jgi:hypothetical protein
MLNTLTVLVAPYLDDSGKKVAVKTVTGVIVHATYSYDDLEWLYKKFKKLAAVKNPRLVLGWLPTHRAARPWRSQSHD